MTFKDIDPQQPKPAAITLVEETAWQLRALLAGLAPRLRPFPAFLNMVSVQAMELEPLPGAPQDRGCVVVLPDGEICELDLMTLPGVQGVTDADQVEQFQELELPADEYVAYAASAIRLVYQELRRRGE